MYTIEEPLSTNGVACTLMCYIVNTVARCGVCVVVCVCMYVCMYVCVIQSHTSCRASGYQPTNWFVNVIHIAASGKIN